MNELIVFSEAKKRILQKNLLRELEKKVDMQRHIINTSDVDKKLKLLKELYILFCKCSIECGMVAIDKEEIELTREFFDKYTKGRLVRTYNDLFSCEIDGVKYTVVKRKEK